MEPALLKGLIFGALPSLLLAALVWTAVWWPRRGTLADARAAEPVSLENARTDPSWAGPLVLGVSAVIAIQVIQGRWLPQVPPRTGTDWLPLIAVVGMSLGLLARRVRVAPVARWAIRGCVLAGVGACVLQAPLSNRFGIGEAAGWLGVFTGVALGAWWGIERLVDRWRGVPGPMLLGLWAFAASQMLVLGYSATTLGQTAAIFAAAMAPAFALAVLRPRFSLAFGGAHVPAVAVSAVMLGGVFNGVYGGADSKYPYVWALIIMLSPVLAAVATLGPIAARLPGWKAWVVAAGLLAGPALGAVGWAASFYQFPDAGVGSDPYR